MLASDSTMIIEHTAVLQGLIRYGVREREEPAYMHHIIIYIEAIKGPISKYSCSQC